MLLLLLLLLVANIQYKQVLHLCVVGAIQTVNSTRVVVYPHLV